MTMRIGTTEDGLAIAKALKPGQRLVIVDVDATLVGADNGPNYAKSTKQAVLDRLSYPGILVGDIRPTRPVAAEVVGEGGVAAYWVEKIEQRKYTYEDENPVLQLYKEVYGNRARLVRTADPKALKDLIDDPKNVVVLATSVADFDREGNVTAKTPAVRADVGPVMAAAIEHLYGSAGVDRVPLLLTSGFGEKNKIAEAASQAGAEVAIFDDSPGAIKKRMTQVAGAADDAQKEIQGRIKLYAVGEPDAERIQKQESARALNNPKVVEVVPDTTTAMRMETARRTVPPTRVRSA